MSAPAPDLGRLVGLLADRALEGLSPGRAAELAGLLAETPGLDDEALDRTAAQLHLALVPAGSVPLAASLRRAVLNDLERSLTETPRRPVRALPAPDPDVDWNAPDPGADPRDDADDGAGDESEPALPASAPPRSERLHGPAARRRHAGPWREALAAAGWVLALVLGGLWLGHPSGSSLERRVARAPDRLELAWHAGPGGGEAVTGTLQWSAAEQAGVADLRGLAPNDPTKSRYELWVEDAEEPRRTLPAALFDVGPTSETVHVAVTPSLPVGRAQRFSVTLEGPRGTPAASRNLARPVAVAGRK